MCFVVVVFVVVVVVVVVVVIIACLCDYCRQSLCCEKKIESTHIIKW